MTTDKRVIWAMGGKSSSLAHAYLNEKALQNKDCLCGRGVKPHIIFEDWDLDNELVAEHTCPYCKKILPLLQYMKVEDEEE